MVITAAIYGITAVMLLAFFIGARPDPNDFYGLAMVGCFVLLAADISAILVLVQKRDSRATTIVHGLSAFLAIAGFPYGTALVWYYYRRVKPEVACLPEFDRARGKEGGGGTAIQQVDKVYSRLVLTVLIIHTLGALILAGALRKIHSLSSAPFLLVIGLEVGTAAIAAVLIALRPLRNRRYAFTAMVLNSVLLLAFPFGTLAAIYYFTGSQKK